jgi:arginine-tRNA-protein transferase
MPEGNGGSALSAWISPLQHFYRTSALPCPYIAGQLERKLITELAGREARALYDELSRAGFRRSHNLAYRPACPSCSGCVPVRVDVANFRPGDSLRRVQRRNADLTQREIEPRATVEQYRLFIRYQRSRHAASDMAEMTYGDYRSMIEDSPIETRLLELREATGRLVGVCLLDRTDDGFSAVYSFFDPAEKRRSLGSLMVMALVERAAAEQLPYVYLGYWIRDSHKMSYKSRFRPLEQLGPRGWERLEPGVP